LHLSTATLPGFLACRLIAVMRALLLLLLLLLLLCSARLSTSLV
jgi:hypothetical protein